MITRMTRNALIGALAIVALTAQAQARMGQVCLELPAGAGSLKTKIKSGCLPTFPKYKSAFDIGVDANTATIAINGGFEKIGDARIGTADCMGSRMVEKETTAAGPRRYSIIINDRFVGVLDASDAMSGMQAVQKCFAWPSQRTRPSPERVTTYRRSQFADWIELTPSKTWGKPPSSKQPPITADTLGLLAAQLLGNHPESKEGRQNAQITFSPARWQRERFQKLADYSFMAIQIEEHGYLDDSISGRRTFAAAKQHPQTGQWRVSAHWQQYMCARGSKAGQWTSQGCI